MEDEEPNEDWLSVRSKHNNICRDQEPSSAGSGGDEGDGGESGSNRSMGVESVDCNGSKAKKIRETVTLHQITPQMKRTGENDIPGSELREQGADGRISYGVGMIVSNAWEKRKEGVKHLKGEKMKGRVEQGGTDGQVMTMAVPEIQKKRLYIKRDMLYWNARKVNLIKIK